MWNSLPYQFVLLIYIPSEVVCDFLSFPHLFHLLSTKFHCFILTEIMFFSIIVESHSTLFRSSIQCPVLSSADTLGAELGGGAWNPSSTKPSSWRSPSPLPCSPPGLFTLHGPSSFMSTLSCRKGALLYCTIPVPFAPLLSNKRWHMAEGTHLSA